MNASTQVIVLVSLAIITLTTYLVSSKSCVPDGNASLSYYRMFEEDKKPSMETVIDAVSGKFFEMKERRKYQGKRLADFEKPSTFTLEKDELVCNYWAVITSINPPTTIVKQLASVKENLCTVIVADKKSPTEYVVNNTNVVYLTVEKQEELKYNIMQLVPWNHFARKNIGFIYAIHHGAKRIFDVDDDNELISAVNIINQVFDYEDREFDFVKTSQYVTNPYMIYLNKPNEYIWPRGYPLEAIKTPHDYTMIYQNKSSSLELIHKSAIVQFIQNVNPDLDAIYRITHTIPQTFDETKNHCLILSKGSFAPFNAQSTLFKYEAFWGMLLPMTVHGRVSDIWRSYFTQKMLWDNAHHIAFCPALVNHIRNQHRLIKDFDAELPLYTQTESMLKYLQEWKSTKTDLPSVLEELYIDLYEKGVLEEKDVHFVQLWIRDLQGIGYSF